MPIIHPKGAAAPQGVVCGPETNVFDRTGGTLSNISGMETYSIRQIIDAISTGGNEVRARFYASTAGALTLKHASVGIRTGSSIDTTETPTELLFGEGSGVAIGSGSNEWSDWTSFTCSASDELIVVMDISDTVGQGAVRRGTEAAIGRGGEVSRETYDDPTPTGTWTLSANVADAVLEVEVRTCT